MTAAPDPGARQDGLPEFSVVSMMREDAAIIRRFIDFYLRAGAREIILFHDGPLPDRTDLDRPGVQLTECDAAFWDGLCGGRPASHEEAQMAVFNAAWRACRSDWLLVVDADEFVLGDRPVRDLLGTVPAGTDALRIPTAEAVWGPGDQVSEDFGCSHFRTALPARGSRLVQHLLYGDLAPLFRLGLLGHTAGKHFVRSGGRISQVRLHDSVDEGRPVGRWAHDLSPRNRSFVVAHFDAISFERWREKWRRRFSGEINARDMAPQRLAQMQAIRAGLSADDDGDAARKLFSRMNGINRLQRMALSLLGSVERRDVFGRMPGASLPER